MTCKQSDDVQATVDKNSDKACYISQLVTISRPTPRARSREHCNAATVVFRRSPSSVALSKSPREAEFWESHDVLTHN